MHSGPVPADPGRDENPERRVPEPDEPVEWVPVVTRPDWMTEEDLQACLDAVTDEDEPWWQQEGDADPDDDPPPGDYDLREIDAEARRAAEDQARADATAARLGLTGALGAVAALNGRRGPGQPGSAQIFPGEYAGRAAQFASGMLFDVMPGRPSWPGSPIRQRARVTPSAAPRLMSCWGCCARGTGWRRTPRRVSTRRWRS